MADYFNRNTKEGWNDEKFHERFNPNSITVLEIDGSPIGFYDVEQVSGEKQYIYVRNIQITEGKRGYIFNLNRLINEEAKSRKINLIRGKVFRDNKRAIRLFELSGYSVIEVQKLDAENSVYIQKEL